MKKPVSKINFETSLNCPRYHSNCGFHRHSWTPSGPMPLRGSHGKVLLAPSLSSFRLWSYSFRALPAACTNRRVSECRVPVALSFKAFMGSLRSSLLIVNSFSRKKLYVCCIAFAFFRRKTTLFWKENFIFLSCFSIDTCLLFSYSFGCIRFSKSQGGPGIGNHPSFALFPVALSLTEASPS